MTQRELGGDLDTFSLWKPGGQSYQALSVPIIRDSHSYGRFQLTSAHFLVINIP